MPRSRAEAPDIIRAELGRAIRKARLRVGLTQDMLGTLSGLAGITIHLYESGRRAPDYEHLCRIAKACKSAPSLLVMALDEIQLPPLPAIEAEEVPKHRRKWK